MYEFDYHRPSSITEAKKLFSELDDASFLAGGHTLLPSMKQRLAAPSDLIDLSAIDGLSGIQEVDGEIVIGAMTCHDDVATSSLVGNAISALARLAGGIGDAQVRNRGTIGGSVSNADPAADYPAGLLGLGARVLTTAGEILSDEFFTGMFETALPEGELLESLVFPVPEAAAYLKFPNPASRYATVGVFVARTNAGIRVAVTGAAASVFRWHDAEMALAADFSEGALAGLSISGVEMNDDLHASADYRAHLCGVMTRRAVAEMTG